MTLGICKASRKFLATLVLLGLSFIPTVFAADGQNTTPCDIHFPGDESVEWECRRLKKNESLESLFKDRWQDVARFNRIDRHHAVPGTKLKVPLRLEEIEGFSPVPKELDYDHSDEDSKFILIDLTDQYLGAYEKGRLVFSSPIASGRSDYITPPGEFRITAYHRRHESSMYKIEEKDIPYPMHYALRFLINDEGIEYWIHGRDLPGYPASHGCVGLYDEEMQKEYYGSPQYPLLDDAKKLYEWVIAPNEDDGEIHYLKKGPRVFIIGEPPGGAGREENTAPGP